MRALRYLELPRYYSSQVGSSNFCDYYCDSDDNLNWDNQDEYTLSGTNHSYYCNHQDDDEPHSQPQSLEANEDLDEAKLTSSYLEKDHEYSVCGDTFKFDSDTAAQTYEMSVYDTEQLSSTPMYEGSRCSLMDALVRYFSWLSGHPGISKEALSDMLSLQHEIFPLGNTLPSSYDSAIKLIEPLLIQPIVFHACRNDCIIFRKEYDDCNKCPKCGEARFTKLGIAAKRFLYLPIGPRLVRLFGTSNLSQVVQLHGLHVSGSALYNIHNSPT